MLPDNTSKLVSRWQGPFRIHRKIGPTNYEVVQPGQWKTKQIYYLNLLKKWEEHKNYLMFPRAVEEEWAPESKDSHAGGNSIPVLGMQVPKRREETTGTTGGRI